MTIAIKQEFSVVQAMGMILEKFYSAMPIGLSKEKRLFMDVRNRAEKDEKFAEEVCDSLDVFAHTPDIDAIHDLFMDAFFPTNKTNFGAVSMLHETLADAGIIKLYDPEAEEEG